MTSESISTPTPTSKIEQVFRLQVEHQQKMANTNARERTRRLNRLQQALFDHREALQQAMYNDFRKPPLEVDMVELFPVISEIRHAKRQLRSWMQPEPVATPLTLIGSRSYIHYEPKGVVLIISPWNFPINLTFAPLVAAIAAGNCVMLKPSEITPHCSRVMANIVASVFPEAEVALVEGGVETSQTLLELPFNHIFFTGSTAVGKIVMAAAAKNLCSVTLELGGKSPTIVDQTADLAKAADRIAWNKFLNTGQICIAPDHVYVHESVKSRFLDLLKKRTEAIFSADPKTEPSYARIVNDHHFQRVRHLLQDALDKGATLEAGGSTDADERYFAPTILSNISPDAEVMEEEIFGPILPVLFYDELDEVVRTINSRPKPLALYVFSKRRRTIDYLINHTRAGGTCINFPSLHFYNYHLPFGGSNNSGIGKAHGKFGFLAFSNQRAVYVQRFYSPLKLLQPPYTKFKERLGLWILKWL